MSETHALGSAFRALGNLCTSPARGVACAAVPYATPLRRRRCGTSLRSSRDADGPAPPATRRADGDCGSIPTALVVNDATASPPPRAGGLDTQAQSAPRAGLVQRFP